MEVILLEKVANLGALGDQVRVKPGYGRNYLIPQGKATPATPENIEKFNAGPWGTLSVWSGKPNMGRNMALTVLYFFLVSLLVAYLTSQARAPGSDFLAVFQIASTGAILAHVLGGAPNGIWFGKRLRFFLTDAIDGLIYALATGAIFALMWPAAETLVNTTP